MSTEEVVTTEGDVMDMLLNLYNWGETVKEDLVGPVLTLLSQLTDAGFDHSDFVAEGVRGSLNQLREAGVIQ